MSCYREPGEREDEPQSYRAVLTEDSRAAVFVLAILFLLGGVVGLPLAVASWEDFAAGEKGHPFATSTVALVCLGLSALGFRILLGRRK